MSAPDAVNCGLCERTPCACPAPDSPSGRPMLREATDAYYNCDCSSEKCEHFRAMEVALNAGATQAGTSGEVPALRLRGDILSSMDELESQARQLGETAYDRGARASIRSYINELRGQITADLNALVACARGNAGEVSRRERPQDQSDDRRALAGVPTREELNALIDDAYDAQFRYGEMDYSEGEEGLTEVEKANDALMFKLDALYAALSAAQRDTERLRTALQRLVDTEMDESGGNYDGAAKLRDAVYDAMEVLGPRLTPSDQRSSSEVK